MKRILLTLSLMIISLSLQIMTNNEGIVREIKSLYPIEWIENLEKEIKWDLVFKSISIVESGGNPSATSTSGDGLLQILPQGSGGYLDEANRLAGYEKYTDRDRFCPDKSRLIWEDVMSYWNPKKDIHKAIRFHNPNGGNGYYNKVFKVYAKLLKANQTIKEITKLKKITIA